MASADVQTAGGIDHHRIATFLSIPDSDIASLVSTITEEYVVSILRSIAAKANDFDELRADKLRIEVELEQSVRTADSRVKSMKGQLDEALKETQELRKRAGDSETARAKLEDELARFKTSQTSVDDATRTLKVRVQTLESDKRDTLEALDRKCNDYDKLQEEYTASQHKSIAIRRELGAMETKLQQAESAQSNAKFRAQSLEQELEMVKKNNEWLDAELKTKTGEHQKFRKEKVAQISRINSELEEALSNVDMLKRSLDSLKERYEEVSRKAEDRLAKIKNLQSSAAAQEEAFKQEFNAQKRLAELYEKAMNTARGRVTEVERIMEQEMERFNIEIGQANSVVETERADREAAEGKVAELEAEVDRLESELQAATSMGAFGGAMSPQGSINGASTPLRRPGSAMGSKTPGSPMFSPAASRLSKQGMSVTQLYADYNSMKAKYETEKRRNARLEAGVAELMRDMEERGPEVQELRDEHARMEKDLLEMSKLLEVSSKERDQAKKEARKQGGRIADYEREANILRQQLRDLSLQIQILTVEIERRDAGVDQLSAQQNRIYEEVVSGNVRIEGQNDTDALISQRLVVFRNVQEMQEQNANLMKAIRELGAKMERDEQDRLQDKQTSDNQEIIRLQGDLQRLQDELKSMILKSQTFVRERDMFRRMLQNKGELTQDGQPMSPAPAFSQSNAGPMFAEMQQNLAEALRNLQSQYDQFKTESMENQNTISEQNRRLAAEKSELEIQAARINSQLEMASERYEMLNGNFSMMKTENQELQKRLTQMHEAQAKQDLKTQQTLEEIVEKNSFLEGLRNENSNLKAEKGLWKTIEQRLQQENESLTQERARLNGLIANLQSIQSEHERNDSEARRRLVSQTERLETELTATKRRLSEEIEQTRKNLIRKEKEQSEAQRRYDELNANYATAKEELVAAKTSRDHLQARVNELTLDLKITEEKLAVYQEKPSAPETTEDDDDSIVEELRLEAANLHRQLELKGRELEDMTEQAERFKSISLANEEQLEELQNSYDQFKESMDLEIDNREATIKDLEQRVDDMSTELSSVNQELSEIRKSEHDKLQQFENEKSILQSQLHNLQEDLEKTTSAAQYHQDDLRRQASIAQEAQQNYERELVKHADAARTVQQLRTEYAELKDEVNVFRTEAESAKAALTVNESSWSSQRENYEKELSEVRARCDDLVKQNRILHGQFETVNEQMLELKKERAYTDEALEVSPEGQPLDKSMEDLREVVRYLRQEKEIVDVQYELALQETKRLKQQLDYTRSQLDDTRVQLSSEQQKQSDQLRGMNEHKEIMEKISELNLLRESNSALRFEGEKKGKKVVELSHKIEELEAKIQPLEQAVRELEAEKEVKDAQMALLNEDNERWKARTQQILQKYDRVDPAELEELKQKAASLEAERDELQQKFQTTESEKESQLQDQATQWRGKMAKLKDDANGRITTMRTRQQELTQEVEVLRQQLEEANKAGQQATAMGGEELQMIRQEKERLEGEVKALEEKATNAEAQSNNHRTKAAQFYRELNQTKLEKQQVINEVQTLRTELESVKTELEAVLAREEELTLQLTAAKSAQPETNDATGIFTSASVESAESIEARVNARVEEVLPFRIEEELPARMDAEKQAATAEIEALKSELEAIKIEHEATRAREQELVEQLATKSSEVNGHGVTEVVPVESAEAIEARMNAKFVERERIIEERIKTAQLKFQDYKAAAVKKAVEDCEAKYKVKHEESQKRISELESEISALKIELKQLKSTIAELESRPATSDGGEDISAALAAKDTEHQSTIVALQASESERFEEAKESLRMEIQAELMAIQQNIDAAEVTPEAAATRDKEKEKLKAIIARNVEHRVNKEKERWLSSVESQQASLVEEKVQTALKERTEKLEEELKEKEAALKAEMEAKEASMKADMEKAKDAIRQEGVMRSKVQINMLERKNKLLEDKLKAATSEAPATPQPQPQQQQQQKQQPQPTSAPPTPAPASAQNLQAAQQAAIAAAEQAISSVPPTNQRRSESLGTGPGALRQLRGALSSGIPRGGAVAGRGRGGIPQPGGAGSPPMQSQQQHQQHQQQQAIQNPFVGTIPTQNPFAGAPSQIGRGGAIPRGGRGSFGRGRGGQQVQTTVGQQHPGQGAGSPTRGGMNPGARQFVPPGSKRPRDHVDGGDDGLGEGKRARSSVGGPPPPVAGGQQGQ